MKIFSTDVCNLLRFSGLALLLSILATTPSIADTQVVMLGTGTPVHNPVRSGPSVAVVVDDKAYIFDFGPGLVRRAATLSPRFGGTISALAASKLNTAFLTHLHSDHTAGFADLLLTGWASGKRDERMKLFGPDGIQKLVDGTLEAYEDDIKYRLYERGKVSDEGWRVDTHVVKKGVVYESDSIKVIAFPVKHGNWPNAFGYRIETRDKVIVISGDQRTGENMVGYSKNADYLIHEVYCQAGFEQRSTEDQRYHASNHTSTRELAQLASEAKPEVLVLTHVLFFHCTKDDILAEVQSAYDGKVIFAEDLDIYE